MKRTVLYQSHVDLGAKMVEFGGWEMPLQYAGVIKEQNSVRQNAGIFDVSHMGEISITGKVARAFVNRLVTNDISSTKAGEITYALMLNENGGTIDDLLVYTVADDSFFLVVNASNCDKDFAWMQKQAEGEDIELKNLSDEYALIALQGPKAYSILSKISDLPENLGYYHFTNATINGEACRISRTGYTGEDGFEIYIAPTAAVAIWDALLEAGADNNIAPAGLAVRDLLRIEAGYPLYGHELTDDINPIDAGLKWAVKKSDADFIGKSVLDGKKRKKKRVGFIMEGRAVARQGHRIMNGDRQVGEVVSGTFSPSLQKPIGIGYISKLDGESKFKTFGDTIQIEIRGKEAPAKICRMPFVESHAYKGS